MSSKPIGPKQARKPKPGSPEHRAHLKRLTTLRLNRELKKGMRSIKVPNHIDPELADEIANEYRTQGWTVTLEDHRHTLIGDVAWRFTFDDGGCKQERPDTAEQRCRDLLGNEIVEDYLHDCREHGEQPDPELFEKWLSDPAHTWNNYVEKLAGDEPRRWYITAYPHKWGRGRSPDAAKKNARKHGGRGTHWVTYLLPEDAQDPSVNQMGQMQWKWPKDWTAAQGHEANYYKSNTIEVARGRGVKKGA